MVDYINTLLVPELINTISCFCDNVQHTCFRLSCKTLNKAIVPKKITIKDKCLSSLYPSYPRDDEEEAKYGDISRFYDNQDYIDCYEKIICKYRSLGKIRECNLEYCTFCFYSKRIKVLSHTLLIQKTLSLNYKYFNMYLRLFSKNKRLDLFKALIEKGDYRIVELFDGFCVSYGFVDIEVFKYFYNIELSNIAILGETIASLKELLNTRFNLFGTRYSNKKIKVLEYLYEVDSTGHICRQLLDLNESYCAEIMIWFYYKKLITKDELDHLANISEETDIFKVQDLLTGK